jgi:outer membrane lipoprotein LolB
MVRLAQAINLNDPAQRIARMKRYIGVLLLLSLVACAPLPEHSDPLGLQLWPGHRAALEAISDWRVNGSIAISSPDQGWDARVLWRQQGDIFQMRFNAPLGQGAMLIDGAPGNVRLRAADGQIYQAADAEELLRQVSGVSLPVGALYYWIRGVPVPRQPVSSEYVNPQGYLGALRQLGWEIEYREYAAYPGYLLPTHIRLKRGEWLIKLSLSSWEL